MDNQLDSIQTARSHVMDTPHVAGQPTPVQTATPKTLRVRIPTVFVYYTGDVGQALH
jgi:hypothetical protein